MTLPLTLAVLAMSAAAAGVLVWLEKRPTEFGRVRLLPTTTLIFLCIIVAVVMLVHLVTLMGGHTGNRFY
ncbi:hypothetical protein [Parvibaculum sp.]|uniref:hypothetical protein n=1 Tax=Parvibaculum sp. TaxID=2024848 RepID=UPI002719F3D5|nr:hypothetical protein [Parvibaculum sp.]MDO9126864.1 hypothetical protein [Parvibaculum sp.]MDP1628504.1 hypothetical protein [Parvibaculum sp.]MDP2151836.1 hypothetical protein [Parvibaculum sp.]MDP3326959.1 hypothetical protein [Parvibaculum sp.]